MASNPTQFFWYDQRFGYSLFEFTWNIILIIVWISFLYHGYIDDCILCKSNKINRYLCFILWSIVSMIMIWMWIQIMFDNCRESDPKSIGRIVSHIFNIISLLFIPPIWGFLIQNEFVKSCKQQLLFCQDSTAQNDRICYIYFLTALITFISVGIGVISNSFRNNYITWFYYITFTISIWVIINIRSFCSAICSTLWIQWLLYTLTITFTIIIYIVIDGVFAQVLLLVFTAPLMIITLLSVIKLIYSIIYTYIR